MFNNLAETIKKLNADISDVSNSEKAKSLRKKLLTWGITLMAVGGIGVFICFVLFGTAGMDAFTDNGFSSRVLVPFFLIIPCAIICSIGGLLTHLGLTILAGGVTTKFVDKSVNNRCECGSTLKNDEIYCSKCGKNARRTCANCGEIQTPGSNFCKKCGTKL